MDDDEKKKREAAKKRFEAERAAAKAGIERAYEAANEQWKKDAFHAAIWCAERMYDFISNDVWERLKQVTDFVPEEGRAMSGVLRSVAAAGHIRRTSVRRPSPKAGNHLNEVMVWKSLIYRPRPMQPQQEQLL